MVLISDSQGLGLGRGGLDLVRPGLGLVSVSEGQISVLVSVSEVEPETPSLGVGHILTCQSPQSYDGFQ